MAGWGRLDWSAWERDRLSMQGIRWPEVMIVTDLRYWDDPIACGGRKRPSARVLAELWGWGKTAVYDIIADRSRWEDPGHSADIDRTPGGHPADTTSPSRADREDDTGHRPDIDRTPGGHSADTPLRYTRAITSTSTSTSTEILSVQGPDKMNDRPKGSPEWRATCDLWDAHLGRDPGTSRTRLTPGAGVGLQLSRIAKYSPDEQALVLRWLAESSEYAGRRENGRWHRKAATVAAHFDDYLTAAADWESMGDSGAFKEEAWRAWTAVLKAIKRKGMVCAAEPFSIDADREAAIRAALRVVPLREISAANDFEAGRLRKLFVEAYAEARENP